MRRLAILSLAIALCAPVVAMADTAMSLGVYLWVDADHDPVKAQFISVANGTSETEIDGPDGSKSDSHPTTPDELRLLTATIKEQMAAMSMERKAAPTGGYITVDWHYSTDTGYADGSTTFALDAVPASVQALQMAAFGATLAK
jgi:hypothetical protein